MIRDLKFKRAANLGLLHQELVAALGVRCCGCSFDGESILVHLVDAPVEVDDQVRTIVEAHNPAGKSDGQKQSESDVALLGSLKDKKVSEWKQDEKDKLLEALLRRMVGI